jgi:peptidoglycan/xylan/chitin deacetylase (PgdA/CDA1 family)
VRNNIRLIRSTSLLSLVLVSLSVPATGAVAPGMKSEHRLLEPGLRLSLKSTDAPTVALTFDACMGKVDHRILDMLVEQKIPATIFVTARWLKRNPDAFAVMKGHPDLFEIEDHGANHVPAVERPVSIYGIKAAGSPEAVAAEVTGGADAIMQAGGAKPGWFRGATAKYSAQSIAQIEAMGYRIAGFSVNGDGGSLLGDKITEKRIAAAKDGDVIISHINQPDHKAGDGVVRGVLALKSHGFRFVLLRDQDEVMSKVAGR